MGTKIKKNILTILVFGREENYGVKGFCSHMMLTMMMMMIIIIFIKCCQTKLFKCKKETKKQYSLKTEKTKGDSSKDQ